MLMSKTYSSKFTIVSFWGPALKYPSEKENFEYVTDSNQILFFISDVSDGSDSL